MHSGVGFCYTSENVDERNAVIKKEQANRARLALA